MSIRISARVVEREARVFRKLWRGSVISSFGTPVLYLSAMGLGLGGIVDARNRSVGGLSYLAFVTPGLMAAGAALSTTGESLWPILSGFKWMRHYQAMSAAAPSPRDIYDGAVAWLGCHVALSSAAFLVVATLLGGVHSAWAPLAVPAAVLGALALGAPLTAFAATQDHDAAFSPIMRIGVFPLFLFSGTFFPVSLLPGWGRALVVVSPLWHAVELCRAATTGHGSWVDIAHVAVLLACIAAGGWWGHRTFTRRLAA